MKASKVDTEGVKEQARVRERGSGEERMQYGGGRRLKGRKARQQISTGDERVETRGEECQANLWEPLTETSSGRQGYLAPASDELPFQGRDGPLEGRLWHCNRNKGQMQWNCRYQLARA